MYPRIIFLLSAAAGTLLIYSLFSRSLFSRELSVDSLMKLHAQLSSLDPHLNSKLTRAEKIWKQSVEDRQRMKQEAGARNFPDGYISPYNVWDFARPSFSCPHDLERVGSLGDGGKIVCGMSRYERESPGPSSPSNIANELVVYSFGVSDDSSFEAALLERTNARIWGYDYSVSSWGKELSAHDPSRAIFRKAGIGKISDESKNPPFFSIQDLMYINGHSYIDIVKMDIEGAEFDALSSLVASLASQGGKTANSTVPFGQLLVEIHFMRAPQGMSVPEDLDSWMYWFSSLEQYGLRPVNNEDNWIGDVGSGKPRFMEYTMINAQDKERNKLLWA